MEIITFEEFQNILNGKNVSYTWRMKGLVLGGSQFNWTRKNFQTFHDTQNSFWVFPDISIDDNSIIYRNGNEFKIDNDRSEMNFTLL